MHHTVPPASVEQEGALERWLKSEEPPADNKGPVRVLTGKTFEEEVFKGGKDTFIKVRAGADQGWGGDEGSARQGWQLTLGGRAAMSCLD